MCITGLLDSTDEIFAPYSGLLAPACRDFGIQANGSIPNGRDSVSCRLLIGVEQCPRSFI